jgi:hypothetical protein
MSQTRRPSSQNRPSVSRPGPGGLRFGMFAVCVSRDSDPGLNKGKAKSLYHLLIAYADVSSRNTAQGYPYRSALADALDCTKDTIDNATKYLEHEIGLIRVVRRKVEGQPDQNDANEYQVFDQWLIQGCEPTPDTPPQLVARYGPTIPGFDIDAWIAQHAPSFDLAGWRAAYEETLRAQEAKREAQRRKEALRRKPKRRGGSGTESATPGGTESATGGGMSAALSRTCSQEPTSRDDALSARSAGDARRASDGSSAREVEGGSAASSNDHPSPNPDSPRPRAAGKKSSSKGKHTREQLDQVRAVRAFFPADLLNGWTNPSTGQTIPPLPDIPVLSQAILDALAGDVPAADRTVAQLGARIQQRWNEHGWASKFYAGEIDSLIGATVAMVRPLKSTDRYGCGNPRCDAGRDVDTGVECHVCPERLAARRKARRNGDTQVPGPRPENAGQKWWECEIPTCRKPGPGPRPSNGLCPDCDAQLEAAAAALMAGSQADAPGPAVDAGPAEGEQEDAGVDEETARLRAMYARQYGTPDQVEAYCTEAPF